MLHSMGYVLQVKPAEFKRVQKFLSDYNDACAFVVGRAAKSGVRGHIALGELPYRDPVSRTKMKVSKYIQGRYNLSSGIADCVVRHCSRELGKRLDTDFYDGNTEIWCSAQTASIRMPKLHPCHVSKYPHRVSLSISNERLVVPFVRSDPEPESMTDYRNNDVFLWVDERDAVLMAFMDLPEGWTPDEG